MKLYELVYLIAPDISEKDVNSLDERIKSFIREEEGLINKINPPTKKKLAYPIKKKEEAFLVDLNLHLKPEKLKDLEKKLKSEKQILRYLILKKKLPKKRKLKREISKALPKLKIKPKTKVELKEIEKKLEEILGE